MEITYDNMDTTILHNAKLILAKKAAVKKHIDTCIEAGICPKCGKEGLKCFVDQGGFWSSNDYSCPHCKWSKPNSIVG